MSEALHRATEVMTQADLPDMVLQKADLDHKIEESNVNLNSNSVRPH